MRWLHQTLPGSVGKIRLSCCLLVVQLLGSQDDLVAPEDNVDLISGGDFLYPDVPYSGHASIIKLDDPNVRPRSNGSC
jgi:hypothetical protein